MRPTDSEEAGGLVGLKTIIVGLTLCCVVASLRSRAWQPVNHDLLVAVALIGMFPRYHPVRPQLFSLLLFALLLLLLQKSDASRRPLLSIPLIFAAWANLHGGFLVGLGVLGMWLMGDLVRMPLKWPRTVALGIAALGATLLTPHGLTLWTFLAETVGLSRPAIKDWQPALTSRPIVLGPWLLVVATAGWAIWRAARSGSTDYVRLAIVLLLVCGSARLGRLDAFLAISVVMLLGPAFGAPRIGPPDMTFLWPRWAGLVAILIALAGTYGFNRRASCLQMRNYPEPEATAFLQEQRGRLVSFFDWGQYAIWHLAPRLKVSMDGRRETVYSEAMIDLHLHFYRGDPSAVAQVTRLAPDFIWLPSSSPAIVALDRRDWNMVFRGPVSVIFSRQPEKAPVQVSSAEKIRCFPDR